ncbi:DUF4868 domain-containing protein [Lactococcus garvieae]|uniref:DUF4868 domain-containing protein n=1 Tax=Lactococcus formosensis TaxID=1281486 RepID=UPI0013FE1971|nr:DUF4868 domain-containing protein [Lactococcus garvieae]
MVKQEEIIEELKPIRMALHGDLSYEVNFYFEYTDSGKTIDDFRYALATTDEKTRKSMLERLGATFSESAISQYNLNEFDILRNDENTFYYIDKDKFDNAKKVIENLESEAFTPEDDLSVLGSNLSKVKGAIVEIKIKGTLPFYLFTKVETFNGFKKGKYPLSLGNIDKNGVRDLTDSKTIFGIRDYIGFYYHNGHFIINSKVDAERMLFLSSEYKKRALETVSDLIQFRSVLVNIETLKDSLGGKGGHVLSRMLMRVSVESLKEKFKTAEAKKKALDDLQEIVSDERFVDDFGEIEINLDSLEIRYTEENKFQFVSLITDRAAETLFLGKKVMD